MAIQAPLPGANRTHTSPFFRAQNLGLFFLALLLPCWLISAILLFLLDLIPLIVPRSRNYLIDDRSFILLLFLYTIRECWFDTVYSYISLCLMLFAVSLFFFILPIDLSSIHHCRSIIVELSIPSLNLVLSLFLFFLPDVFRFLSRLCLQLFDTS